MIKFNRLAFIAVVMALPLLTIGNLATHAQANNADVVTPIPTSTPIFDPTPQGEPVSPEQQEELKGIIEAYFEIRYQALSVSKPDGFQLDRIGDLVSTEPNAKAFLHAELGKLAVGIKHAELNHIRSAKYNYFLEFRNIAVDSSAQLATVSVVEESDFVDEISMEFSPEDPFVSHTYNLEHTIVLRREPSQWKIISDDYTDYLWRMLRQTGISTDEILNNMQASPRPSLRSQTAETTTASTLPADASTHPYDRTGAVAYAVAHANNYNLENYPTYAGAGGDCTNFVSQAIYEGGNASMFIPSPLPPPAPDGKPGWYLISEGQRASAWNDVNFFIPLSLANP
jgi:hypothetical protein